MNDARATTTRRPHFGHRFAAKIGSVLLAAAVVATVTSSALAGPGQRIRCGTVLRPATLVGPALSGPVQITAIAPRFGPVSVKGADTPGRFVLERSLHSRGSVELRVQGSREYVTASRRGGITTRMRYQGDPSALFRIEAAGGGLYRLRAQASGRYVHFDAAGNAYLATPAEHAASGPFGSTVLITTVPTA